MNKAICRIFKKPGSNYFQAVEDQTPMTRKAIGCAFLILFYIQFDLN